LVLLRIETLSGRKRLPDGAQRAELDRRDEKQSTQVQIRISWRLSMPVYRAIALGTRRRDDWVGATRASHNAGAAYPA
jgi:hypothetical protein